MTLLSDFKKGGNFSNFVAFSQYLNFKKAQLTVLIYILWTKRELGGDIITKDIICVYWSANKARGTAASVIHRSPAVDLESELKKKPILNQRNRFFKFGSKSNYLHMHFDLF